MKNTLRFILPAFLFLFSMAAIANETGTSLGVLGGWTSLNNGGGTPFTIGADLGGHLGPISPGITYNTLNPNSTVVNGTSYSQGVSNLYLHAEIMFGDLGAGGLAGVNWWNSSSPTAVSANNFIYGLLAHWDWALAPSVSIGPRVDLIWSSQSSVYTQIDAVAVLKLWL